MHDQTAQVDDLRLVALPSAMNCADLFVRFTLTEWRLQEMLSEATELTDRLVRSVVGDPAPSDPPAMMSVRLRIRGGCLVVEVDIDRTTPPLAVPRDLTHINGDVMLLPGGGQLIWAELPLPAGTAANAVPLPRRGTTRTPTISAAADDEPDDVGEEVMQRILSALNRKQDSRHSRPD